MKILTYKTALVTGFLSLPTLAMAHPNHGQMYGFVDALQAGIIHPLTGADHMMLAIGMGMLMYRYRQSALGLTSLSIGLVAGFGLTVMGILSESLATYVEYGILASVIIVAMALLSQKFQPKKPMIVMLGLLALGMFHGMAHGLEVPNPAQAQWFFVGMIVSMATLFGIGILLMKGILHYFGENSAIQKLLAVLGLVAVALN